MRLLLQNQIIISCLLATTTAQLPTSSPAPTGFFGPPTIIATLPAATTSTTANIATLPAIPNPTYEPTENTIQTPAPVFNAPVPSPIPVVNTPVPVLSTPQPTDPIPLATPAPTDPQDTDPPTPSPSMPPISFNPTNRPTSIPTAFPTNPPTPRPTTEEPTIVTITTGDPTPVPTPVSSETIETPAPTNDPVAMPTPLPSNQPSRAPSNQPSRAPTDEPTYQPITAAPTEQPTEEPTLSSQEFPTTSRPTKLPTEKPNEAPTIATNHPSISDESPAPTPPTVWPTSPPKSTRPTDKLLGPTSVTNLKITLAGIDHLPDTNQWAKSTASFFQDWYNRNSKDPLSVQYNIYDAEVRVYYEAETPGQRFLRSILPGRRQLQSSSSVEVTYTQSTKYRTKDSTMDIYEIVESPLEQQADRDVYIKTLKDMDGYEDLTDVSTVTVPGDGGDQITDGSESQGGLSTGAIIGIACGSVAAAVLLGGLIFIGARSDKDSEAGDRGTSTQTPTLSSTNQVSSRFDPVVGDQSVITMDYDYSKAYGGAGNYSLSDAGGTLGSRTRQTAADPALIPGSGGTIFSDDNTFDQAYEGVREELLDIYAPAGKLGVVIDTPNDGPPVVHAVKDTSPIADKIRVGDRLVAVDDEDVRDMTAIKVSKLISRKSTNASRKMTVIRTVAE